MKKIKPYSEGWEKLSVDDRIKLWIDANQSKLGKRKDTFKNFLYNFSACYKSLNANSLEQLTSELKEEYWLEGETGLVRQGVFAMYNTSPSLLELKMFNDKRERYKFN